jgi:D-alanyl-D-alanine endopeptidase (penicillin-binding protein 7)
MLIKTIIFPFAAIACFLMTAAPTVLAMTPTAEEALQGIYAKRADLRAAFRADGSAVAGSSAGDMASLEVWARRYGYLEHPADLRFFAPGYEEPSGGASGESYADGLAYPNIGSVDPGRSPKLVAGAEFDFSRVTASKVLVVDVASRDTLLANQATSPHPLASISKLMAAKVFLDSGVSMWRTKALVAGDEVGGARLRVPTGTSLSLRDIFDATLVGSANNTAYAMARATGMGITEFVAAMNRRAEAMKLEATRFVDPSGLEVGNTSTAVDIARMAYELFNEQEIKRATTTAKASIKADGVLHEVKNTNGLLTDPDNGLYVLGGKTGYLVESRWNLVVKMRDRRMKEILVVVLGSASQQQSFVDAERAAEWAWDSYRWP